MDIEERIRAVKQAASTAVRESGGVVCYLTISEKSVSVHVKTAANKFCFGSRDVDLRWYNASAQKFAATFEEVAAMRAGDDEGEE